MPSAWYKGRADGPFTTTEAFALNDGTIPKVETANRESAISNG